MDWADRIGRRIRLRDLHIVLAVAEWGSMAKAASQLAISHPVISKTVSDLEHTLGVRLFDRNPRGVELTSYGEALLQCGVTVFDEMRQGLRRLEFLAVPDSGELRIGCSEITMAALLPAIAEEFSQRYPRVQLHTVLASTAAQQFQELRERSIDLLVVRMPRPFLEEDLTAEILFDEPFRAVAGARSKWARCRHVELADLVDEPWVLPPYDSLPGSFILEIFRANKLPPPRARIISLSGQLTVTLVAGGRFVGLLPSSVAQFNARRVGLKILPVTLPPLRFAVGIITVKNRTLSPLAELFIGCARDVARAIADPAKLRSARRGHGP
jgi:DNA-binding transcriptional LysR family regulator